MKIGVTGSDHICDRIQKTLEKRMPDLEVVYRRSNDYRYGLEAAAQFQKGKVSGIIFTGPTNYHYALKRLEPNVPWTFLPHNQASILKALAESAVRYSCVPDVISIDMYEEQLVQETLEEIGISNGRVLVAHGSSPDQGDFQDALTDFHRYNYFHNGAKICFTNMEKTYEATVGRRHSLHPHLGFRGCNSGTGLSSSVSGKYGAEEPRAECFRADLF